jgi:hypothetical protein
MECETIAYFLIVDPILSFQSGFVGFHVSSMR